MSTLWYTNHFKLINGGIYIIFSVCLNHLLANKQDKSIIFNLYSIRNRKNTIDTLFI